MLIDHGADILIHLGDIGSVEVIDALAAAHPGNHAQIESHVVLGNCDYDAKALGTYARDLGVAVHEPAGELNIDGCRLAFTHGHLPTVVQSLMADEPDFLLHGHTHQLADHRVGPTRVVNPGALFRASRHTAAMLCPADGSLEVIEVASVTR